MLRSTVFSAMFVEMMSVSLETLLAAFVSAVPVGAAIAAVFVTAPAALALTVAVTVNVAVPPAGNGVVLVKVVTLPVVEGVHPAGDTDESNVMLGDSTSVSVAP